MEQKMTPADREAARQMREPDEYNKRMTLQEIATHFGVSREWIRQVVGNTGFSTQRKQLEADKWEIAYQIHRLKTETYQSVATRTGLSLTTVKATLPGSAAFDRYSSSRVCRTCGLTLPLGEFYPSNQCLSPYCKSCNSIRRLEWYHKNRERENKYHREYNRNHREMRREDGRRKYRILKIYCAFEESK
mgnify:FL=1